ncbi:molecular chaperone Hsp33 [Alteromonadaceae bacterium Bs31]|nr:molecular chaperone Hsp33 [Alteromonadaceae bacterium Bs31]
MSKEKNDLSQRFLFEKTDIRGQIVSLEKSFQQVLLQQNLPRVLLPILGEFIAAVSLLSETLKFEGTLTLQVRGDGQVPLVVAEATNEGNVRGILKIHHDLLSGDGMPADDLFDASHLKSLVGQGVLTLTIDPAKGERYQGIVPLDGNTLADCLSHYFQQSEQLPTKLWLFADEHHAAGLMLQSLPPQLIKDEEQRQELWSTAVQLAATVRQEELFELEHDTLLYRLFHELQCRIFPARDIQFKCSCTRARSENAIASLGREEAFTLLKEEGKIAIDCQFCGKHYAFKSADLQRLFGDEGKLH